MNGKSFLNSWTLWFNTALLIAPEIIDIINHFANVGIIPGDIALRVVGVLNILLRLKTNQPVTLKK